MGLEIERKFLVDHKAWKQLNKPGGKHYKQGYLLSDEERTVRVRITDTHSFITIKGKGNGITRSEYEYEIPLTDGNEILNNLTRYGTEKIRYRIPYHDFVWEVDEFSGDNQGLIIAEIELKNEHDIFEKPDWVTTEVTDDDRYSNASLAQHPFKNW